MSLTLHNIYKSHVVQSVVVAYMVNSPAFYVREYHPPQPLLLINFPINHTNPLRNVTQGRIESLNVCVCLWHYDATALRFIWIYIVQNCGCI